MKQVVVKLGISILCIVGAVVGIWWVVTRQHVPADDAHKLHVTASYYPLYEFARAVGGDAVVVHNITPAGAEPHDFEPAANVLARAQSADVFVYNGTGMEPWAAGFAQTYSGIKVPASNGLALRSSEGGHKDPHFWLDPVDAQHIVANLRDTFTKIDPAHRSTYQQNAYNYITKLTKLDNDYRQTLQHCQQHTVVTSHDAFEYVAQRYGFTVLPIAGLSPEEEPSAAHLADVATIVRQKGLKYIFFESLVSPRLADTIATETGAKTLVFDPLEGVSDADQKEGKDYVSIQRQNLQNLATALACR